MSADRPISGSKQTKAHSDIASLLGNQSRQILLGLYSSLFLIHGRTLSRLGNINWTLVNHNHPTKTQSSGRSIKGVLLSSIRFLVPSSILCDNFESLVTLIPTLGCSFPNQTIGTQKSTHQLCPNAQSTTTPAPSHLLPLAAVSISTRISILPPAAPSLPSPSAAASPYHHQARTAAGTQSTSTPPSVRVATARDTPSCNAATAVPCSTARNAFQRQQRMGISMMRASWIGIQL